MNSEGEVREYLRAAARLEGMNLDESQLDRLTQVYQRNLELARVVLAIDLDPGDELAPVFQP